VEKSAKMMAKSARITAQGMGRDSFSSKNANFVTNMCLT
jgi:hypothetical protein